MSFLEQFYIEKNDRVRNFEKDAKSRDAKNNKKMQKITERRKKRV